jgi:hypothetical protein
LEAKNWTVLIWLREDSIKTTIFFPARPIGPRSAASTSEARVRIPAVAVRLGSLQKQRIEHQELAVRAAPVDAANFRPGAQRGQDEPSFGAARFSAEPNPAADSPVGLACSSRPRLQADTELVSGVLVVFVSSAASTVAAASVDRRQTFLH